MKNRILYLDIIRILACIMIIAMHAPIPNTGLNAYLLSADSLLTAPGIGLFIMVSGALLLPVNMSTEQFLKKRFSKIIGPTVFWTIFYFLLAPYTDTLDQGNGFMSFISIPFSPQFNSVFWFMYMLAGLYLLAPILSAWLRQSSQKETLFYLILWGITMCYPLIRHFIAVDETHTGILYYFGGYVGYFILGYYLKNYTKNVPVWKSLFLLAIPLSIAASFKVNQVQIDFYDLFWYLSAFVAMMAVAWFMLAQNIKTEYDKKIKWHRCVVILSNCCFGIYLVHIFIMRAIIWKWSWVQELDGLSQIFIVSFLTFVGSFIITRLIAYLPWAHYIIGIRYPWSHK